MSIITLPKNYVKSHDVKPFITYPAIKTKEKTFYNAICLRGAWMNKNSTEFYTYHQYVIDIERYYQCPNCNQIELLWDSAFDDDNEFTIFCDTCKNEYTLKLVDTTKG